MSEPTSLSQRGAWDVNWLTPSRCRMLLVAFLVLGGGMHLIYLHSSTCVDLAGDEAQYWDWSRRLDLSYYSKGPLVAYIIRASCALFGDTMPAVRYPALLLGAGTSIFAYLLTLRLFRSDRLALGATLLFALVPMFVAGSMLMTIDPPMMLCWSAASYFAATALFRKKPQLPVGSWIAVGVFIGLGFLAKYADMLFFVGLFGFVLTQRRRLVGPAIACVVASGFTLPVLLWNYRHNWVSLRHVARQTGAQAGSFNGVNVLEMVGGQIGAVGPTVFVLMTAAVVHTLLNAKDSAAKNRQRSLFLLWIGLPFFALNLLASVRTKVQVNWPAPAYFTLIILTAWFVARKLHTVENWRPWRPWFWASVAIALIVLPIAHDTTLLYPLLRRLPSHRVRPASPFSSNIETRDERAMDDFDPLARLRGWEVLGQHVYQLRNASLSPPFVLCDDYMQTAEMAFYQPDHPPTYCAGPYFGKRFSQYDLWPDRRLDASSPLIGRDAIYVGKGGVLPAAVGAAFDRVEKLPDLPIRAGGALVRTFKLWRCTRYKGMTLPSGLGDY